VQPLSLFECQTSDEITEPGTGDELIHFDSLPLCFSSFQIVRGNLGDIRTPPGLSHWHYPDAFDPEMDLQLRERNTATLDEMKNVAVDVEADLLKKKARLKALMKDRIEKEHLISSEMKLDILTNTINQVMHNISRKEELVVRKPYVPLGPERTKINVPKLFPIQP
jgi:hypothetical protein